MGIVICRCGMWLKSPEDGGVGSCPSCGRIYSRTGTLADDDPARQGSTFVVAPKRWGRPATLKAAPALPFREALTYPLVDGPGVALLAFFPPLLTFMSVPVFDIVMLFQQGPRGNFNPLALLILPFALPLGISFAMLGGYILLFLARVLVASSMGRADHPDFPLWNSRTIAEGLARWAWAGLVGIAVGGAPIAWYLAHRPAGPLASFDLFVIVTLVLAGVAYAQMILAAAILHDSITGATPVAVVVAIGRIGGEYVYPTIVTGGSLLAAASAWFLVMYHAPSMGWAAVGLWGFWILVLYEAMVAMRVLGWCYHRNGAAIGWFRIRPRWGAWDRVGRIYSNS